MNVSFLVKFNLLIKLGIIIATQNVNGKADVNINIKPRENGNGDDQADETPAEDGNTGNDETPAEDGNTGNDETPAEDGNTGNDETPAEDEIPTPVELTLKCGKRIDPFSPFLATYE
ncbi:putative SP-containing protein [Vairimorpha necatrix]|uniref:SP-containing protein n=1 Tax=Vairimorpha necatrix TaxID=6039 RepID=A0AAX4JGU7_9MICR